MYHFTETTQKDIYDTTIDKVNTPLVQSFMYGAWQQAMGKVIRRFCIYNETTLVGKVTYIAYPLGPKHHYWYAPYGPVLTPKLTDIEETLDAIRDTLTIDAQTVFVRMDGVRGTHKWHMMPRILSHTSSLQPRNEWCINTAQQLEDVLAHMHQKTRYNVRLAEKKNLNVHIEENPITHFDTFYGLQVATAERNHFSLHPKHYYETILRDVSANQMGVLVEVSHGTDLLTSHLLIRHESVTYYLFGGSSDIHKEYMPSYLAQYAGMQYAHNKNTHYNMGGISPDGAEHKLDQLTHFKTRFGGYKIAHTDAYDSVQKPFIYLLYSIRAMLKNILKK